MKKFIVYYINNTEDLGELQPIRLLLLFPEAITNLYLLFNIQTYCVVTAPAEKQNHYEWCGIRDLWWGFNFT